MRGSENWYLPFSVPLSRRNDRTVPLLPNAKHYLDKNYKKKSDHEPGVAVLCGKVAMNSSATDKKMSLGCLASRWTNNHKYISAVVARPLTSNTSHLPPISRRRQPHAHLHKTTPYIMQAHMILMTGRRFT